MRIDRDKVLEIIKYLDSIDEKTEDEDITLIRNLLSASQKMYYRLLPQSKKEKHKIRGKLGAIIKTSLNDKYFSIK